MAAFPTTVATDADLYIAVNALSTQLTDNPLTSGATTVNVVDTTGFPTVGFISIDNEIIKYTGKTGTSFTGCTRGADGTSATSHVQNSQVFHNVIAAHHNSVKDDLIATQQFISDLVGRATNQIKGPDGTAALPGHSFGLDLDSGLYRVGANDIALATNGVKQFEINTTNVTSFLAHLFQDGTVSLPGIAFAGDADTGIRHPTGNAFSIVTNGVDRMGVDSAGNSYVTAGVLNLDNGTAALPVLTFASDTDTGLYRESANALGFASAGALRARLFGDQFEMSDGTNTSPAWTFRSDLDCGLYRIGANNIALATNAIRALEITSAQAVKIKGTVAADSATAGDMGEFVESVQGTNVNSPGTNQWFDITSISLTAGDWDVWMIGAINSANYTVISDQEFGIGTVSGNNAPGGNNQLADWLSISGTPFGKVNQTFYKRFTTSSTATYYAKALVTFSSGTQSGIAKIWARRVR